MVEVGCAVECARSFELRGEDLVTRLAYRGCHVILEKSAYENTIPVLVHFHLIKVTRRVFDVKVEVREIRLGSSEVLSASVVTRWRPISSSNRQDANESAVGVVCWYALTYLPPFCGSTPS